MPALPSSLVSSLSCAPDLTVVETPVYGQRRSSVFLTAGSYGLVSSASAGRSSQGAANPSPAGPALLLALSGPLFKKGDGNGW